MIESGTDTPGVDPAAFVMPPGIAMRLERPDAAFAGVASDYVMVDSEGPGAMGLESWGLPHNGFLRFRMFEAPVTMTIGRRRYPGIPIDGLYGPSNVATKILSNGGYSVGITFGPLAWSRLIRRPANTLRNHITHARDEMWVGAEAIDALAAQLRESTVHDVKAIFDSFLAHALRPPHPDEPVIAAFIALAAEEHLIDVADVEARLGIDSARLRRITIRHLGFPPKTLLIRARFLRAFARVYAVGGAADYSRIGDEYHDASHFLRDAQMVLGLTPRRVNAMRMPFLEYMMRARDAVFGAPSPLLARNTNTP